MAIYSWLSKQTELRSVLQTPFDLHWSIAEFEKHI